MLAGVLILALANYTIYSRERLLATGTPVLLRLAPVDPRSLIQGDYMALRFEAADAIQATGTLPEAGDGRAVIGLDGQGVGSFRRLYGGGPLAPEEVLMGFRVREGRLRFATDAFFFQEGDAGLYADARYGAFRVGGDGRSILTGLRDGELRRLGPP